MNDYYRNYYGNYNLNIPIKLYSIYAPPNHHKGTFCNERRCRTLNSVNNKVIIQRLAIV